MKDMTLGAWLETWMELYVMPSDLAYNTKMCYNRAVRAVQDDTLHETFLSSLSALDIVPYLLRRAAAYPRAAQLDRVMLSRALKVAAKLHLCDKDIMDPDVCPKISHTAAKAVILDGEQLLKYMQLAADSPAAPVLLALCCGLRRSEARGLRWENIDLQEGVMRIVGQRIGAAAELAPLKTAAATRALQMPALLQETLRKWPWCFSGWLCDCSESQIYREHRKVLAALQLPPVTLHGLRHSFATYAVQRGTHIKTVQAALGHSHFALTADLYADHLPEICKLAAGCF